MAGEVAIRRAVMPVDEAAVVALLRQTMGWAPDSQAERLFRWKHRLNPAGASPMWLGEFDGELVGLRAFLRWDFVHDGHAVLAVRAVDTVTHPDHRGKGLFTKMTLGAIDDLRDSGVDFIFNTPNALSLPGYKKMGWQEVGRLPALVNIPSLLAIPKVVRSRGPADLGSLPCTVGRPAEEVLGDRTPIEALLKSTDAGPDVSPRMRTRKSFDFLRWRYVEAPLGYRVMVSADGVSGGIVIFRLRRRVRAIEATIADVIVPGNDPNRHATLVSAVAKTSGADYAVMMSEAPRSGRWIRMGSGPMLTARTVSVAPPGLPKEWALTLGDIELF